MPKPYPPVRGKPPHVETSRRKGRFVTTGDDTPTLIALVVALIGLIIFLAFTGAMS